MVKELKKFILGFLCGAVIFSASASIAQNGFETVTAYINKTVSIMLNGEKVVLKNQVINYKNTNYLPIRDVAELTGLDVNWNGELNRVELGTNSNEDFDLIKEEDYVVLGVLDLK